MGHEKLKEDFEREQEKIRFKEHEKEHLEGKLKDAEVLLKKQLEKTKTNLKKVEDAHTVIERQLRKERMTWFEKEKEYQDKITSLEKELKEKEAMSLSSEALWKAQMSMGASPPSSPSSPSQRQLHSSAPSGNFDPEDAAVGSPMKYAAAAPSSGPVNAQVSQE